MRRNWRLAAVAALCAWGCGDEPAAQLPPIGQILLQMDTDAPLPAAETRPFGIDEPIPLFDRLQIEVFEPFAEAPCSGCLGDFSVNAEVFAARQASVGIPLPPGVEGYRARVRLYRAGSSLTHEPVPAATIEAVVGLPAVRQEGIVEASVFLPINLVGQPIGTLDEPVPPGPALAGPSLVGTWPDAQRRPCQGVPAADEVCVPGGAFWMGNPMVDESLSPRIIVVSPFFMQTHETTVAELREVSPGGAYAWGGHYWGSDFADYCIYTVQPGPHEQLAANCVFYVKARAACAARGGELPSEAQFEYAAGGLANHLYVWGSSDPSCDDASWGRNPPSIGVGTATPCTPDEPGPGPLPPGSGQRDRLELPGGAIVDLTGNVSEWTRDYFQNDDEPCWKPAGPRYDPTCDTPPPNSEQRVLRGGHWETDAKHCAAANRSHLGENTTSVSAGFRCVRPAG